MLTLDSTTMTWTTTTTPKLNAALSPSPPIVHQVLPYVEPLQWLPVTTANWPISQGANP